MNWSTKWHTTKPDVSSRAKDSGTLGTHRASFWTRLFDLMAPRTCAACGERLAESERQVCTSCLLTLPRTHYARATAWQDNEMARLFWGRVEVERAAAWFFYRSGTSMSQMVHQMKYHHQPLLARHLGHLAAEEMSADGFFDGVDLLVPVPLTRRRERQRGYNQSREIARGISEVTGISMADRAVIRTRFEESQTRKSAAERMANVEGVFELTDAAAVAGRHVMLVDDVMTTGATLSACCRQLSAATDIKVSVFALSFAHG